MPSGYRLAPALGARLLGSALVLVAVVVVVVTFLAAVLDWPTVVVLVVAGGAVLLVLVAGYLLLQRIRVVTLDESGYRVRLVRGAGVRAASWSEVADAVTGQSGGVDCLVLRLKDGRSTTIPVQAVAADRDRLVADVRDHLHRAEGLRPL